MKLNLNKKNIIILISIFIIIAGIVIFIIFNKKETKKEEPIKEETTVEKYNKLLDYASITGYLNSNSLPDDLYGYFFREESTKNNEISNKVKIYMAIRNLLYENNETDYTKDISFTEKEVSNKIKEMFGHDTKVKHESLDGETCSFSNFKYDSKKKEYTQTSGECLTARNDNIYYKLIDEKMTDNEKIITVRVGFTINAFDVKAGKVKYYLYSDINKENLVLADYTIDENIANEKLNKYKFIFIKEDTNNFYLDRVEMVK